MDKTLYNKLAWVSWHRAKTELITMLSYYKLNYGESLVQMKEVERNYKAMNRKVQELIEYIENNSPLS